MIRRLYDRAKSTTSRDHCAMDALAEQRPGLSSLSICLFLEVVLSYRYKLRSSVADLLWPLYSLLLVIS